MNDAVREQTAKRILELEKERDALVAQLCSVQSAFDKVVSYGRFDNGTTNVSLAVLRNVQAAIDADPGACLARRDTRVAAEALEKLADNFAEAYAGRLRHEAAEYRRQAEEAP